MTASISDPVSILRAIRLDVADVKAARERANATELIDLSQMHLAAAADHAARLVDRIEALDRSGVLRAFEEFLNGAR